MELVFITALGLLTKMTSRIS